MRVEVRFNHMDRSEALEEFATTKVMDVIEEHLHSHDGHIMIWLQTIVGRRNKGTPEFRCEIEVRYPPKHDVFVSKTNSDMHIAVNDTALALKQVLRESGKRDIQRRYDSVEINPEMAATGTEDTEFIEAETGTE